MDMTVRPHSPVAVALLADNSVELSWSMPGNGQYVILLAPDEATDLHEKLGLKLLMVER
jgi:hypothetical protein